MSIAFLPLWGQTFGEDDDWIDDGKFCRATFQQIRKIVSGKDISDDTVELFFNQEVTPGFFVWLIPSGDGLAKLGCGGNIINIDTNILYSAFQTKGI